jgi:hypothetical protein
LKYSDSVMPRPSGPHFSLPPPSLPQRAKRSLSFRCDGRDYLAQANVGDVAHIGPRPGTFALKQ